MIKHVQTVLVWKDPEKELPSEPCECLIYDTSLVDTVTIGAWNGENFVTTRHWLGLYEPNATNEDMYIITISPTLYAVLPDESRIEALLEE